MDEDWEIDDESSCLAWLKEHWEVIAFHIIIWSLLTIM